MNENFYACSDGNVALGDGDWRFSNPGFRQNLRPEMSGLNWSLKGERETVRKQMCRQRP